MHKSRKKKQRPRGISLIGKNLKHMRVNVLDWGQVKLSLEFVNWLWARYRERITVSRSLAYRAEHGIGIEKETAQRLREFLQEKVTKSDYKEILPKKFLLESTASTPTGISSATAHSSSSNEPIKMCHADTILRTNWNNLQLADYQILDLRGGRLQRASATIHTLSPYFRFGFKLKTPQGPLFGDGGIKSSLDPNMLVHIGRNNGSQNIFFTSYKNGVREGADRVLWEVPQAVVATMELVLKDPSVLVVMVNKKDIHHIPIPRNVDMNLVMYAWGDADEFEVAVKKIELEVISVRAYPANPAER